MRRNIIYKATIDDGTTLRVAAANRTAARDLLDSAFPDAKTLTLVGAKGEDGKIMRTTAAGILDAPPSCDDGNPVETLDGLAATAADYVRRHRSERQSTQLTSRQTVTLTVIQNQWAKANGMEPLDIAAAPTQVMDAIETTPRGHALFDRMRDRADGTIAYGLRRNPEQQSRKE